MTTAKVKWFNDARGYGFLAPETEGPDVFFHHSNIIGHDRPVEGDKVTYDIASDLRSGKPHATNVKIID